VITVLNEEGAPWSTIHIIDGNPLRVGKLWGEWAWVGRIDDPDRQIATACERRATVRRIAEMRAATR